LAVAAAVSVAGCRRLRGGERAGADDTRPARGMLRRRARAGGAHTYGARGRVDVRSGGLLAPGDRERLRPHGEFFKIAAVTRAPAAARLVRAAGKSTVMQPDLEPQHALGRRPRAAAERWLESLPSEPAVVRVGTHAAVTGLEDRIAQLDDLLSEERLGQAPLARLVALQQERTRLVGTLAQVRYAEELADEWR